MRTPPRRNATLAMSWMAAPEALVTTPDDMRVARKRTLLFGANRPSAEQLVLSGFRAPRAARRDPAGRAMSPTNWSRPRGAHTVARPRS